MINEELLAAYAEGALAPADRIKVEAAAARDPSIARRLMDQVGRRRRGLGTPTQAQAFQRRPALGGAPPRAAPPEGAVIVDLATIRASRSRAEPPAQAEPQWRSLLSPAVATAFVAASLTAGLVTGALLTAQPVRPRVIAKSGSLYADGSLVRALNAAQAGRIGAVLVGPGERAADGRTCRAFRLQEPAGLAGVACKSAAGWRLELTVADDGRPSADGLIFPRKIMTAMTEMTVGHAEVPGARAEARPSSRRLPASREDAP